MEESECRQTVQWFLLVN